EGLVEHLEVALQSGQRIDVARRADFGGDLLQRHVLAKQLIVLVLKVMHRRAPSRSARFLVARLRAPGRPERRADPPRAPDPAPDRSMQRTAARPHGIRRW